jgi:uncharacterized membrane protein YkvA (DUF1232 family)
VFNKKEIKMTNRKNSDITTTQQGGVVRNVLNQLKLIFRLMADKRVNGFAKLVPIGALVYLFSPDPIMFPIIGVVDDAALLWLGSYVFTELCPPDVVQEHMKALAGDAAGKDINDDVIDAETTDIESGEQKEE